MARSYRVYEVDHPATQRWKRARLEEQGIALPRSLTWVPVDFETQSLADRLHAAGFRRDMPAFISWLGVTMYLSREAVMQTLRFVAGKCARGSEIVFDFSLPDDALGETERAARARLAPSGSPRWASPGSAGSIPRRSPTTSPAWGSHGPSALAPTRRTRSILRVVTTGSGFVDRAG